MKHRASFSDRMDAPDRHHGQTGPFVSQVEFDTKTARSTTLHGVKLLSAPARIKTSLQNEFYNPLIL